MTVSSCPVADPKQKAGVMPVGLRKGNGNSEPHLVCDKMTVFYWPPGGSGRPDTLCVRVKNRRNFFLPGCRTKTKSRRDACFLFCERLPKRSRNRGKKA